MIPEQFNAEQHNSQIQNAYKQKLEKSFSRKSTVGISGWKIHSPDKKIGNLNQAKDQVHNSYY